MDLKFQTGHRRGRSLSEELTLEETERGGLVVSEISNSANQKLKKGDEIVGATIHFDELSKDDVLKLLKLIEPYDKKVELLSKKTKRPSKSLWALDRCVKAPEEMLKDSYNRLYNDKIKKFIKGNTSGGAVVDSINREFKPRLKYDTQCSMQGLDTNTTRVDTPHFLNDMGILNDPRGQNSLHIEAPDITTDSPNNDTSTDLNIQGLEPTRISNVSLPKTDLTVPDHSTQKDNFQEKSCSPEESNITVPALDIDSEKRNIEEKEKEYKIPNSKTQDFGLYGPNIRPGCKVTTSDLSLLRGMGRGNNLTKSKLDLSAPDVSVPTSKSKVRVQSHKKNPDLNVDDPSGYMEVAKVRPSVRAAKVIDNNTVVFKTPDTDIKYPLIGDSHDPRLLNSDLPSAETIHFQTADITSGSNKKPQIDLISPDILHDGPFELHISGTLLKRSNLAMDFHNSSIDAPQIKGIPDLDLSTPQQKGDMSASDYLKGTKMDLTAPDLNINMPSVTFLTSNELDRKLCNSGIIANTSSSSIKMPKLFGTLSKNTPELSLKAPIMKSGIDVPDLPKANLKELDLGTNTSNIDTEPLKSQLHFPKLRIPNFELPELNEHINVDQDGHLDRPELEVGVLDSDFDTESPSSNLNGPQIDLKKTKADVGSPGFSISGSVVKLSKPDIDPTAPADNLNFEAPMDLPNIDVKSIQLDLNSPNVEIGSPQTKFKIPKLKMPTFGMLDQGPNVYIHGDVNAPDFHSPDLHISDPEIKGKINARDLKLSTANLRGPKLDGNAPNMNLKMPTVDPPSRKLKMPSFGFLEKQPKRPNMDIDTGLKKPDLSLNAPHLKGGIDVPGLDLPNIDVKVPQLDLNSPNVDIGSPQTKFKLPKLKMPTFGMSGLKGPNVDIHGDVKAPDFHSPEVHISDPNLKVKINTPDLKLPTANLKGPKLDVNAPNMNLKMPSGKLSVPNLKKPKAELDALDFDVDPPSGKLKMPSFGFSGKQPKRPNMDIDTGLKTPDLSLNAPHLKGGIDVPVLDLPNIDVEAPQLDLNSPNVDIGSPQTKFKLPKLKMPTFGMSGLKGPNVDIHGDVKAPDFHSPEVHISDPNLKVKINTPDLKLPTANLKDPKLDVNAPNMNLKMPSGKLSVPNLKKPKAELDALDFDVDPPSGKLKMPSFGFSAKQTKIPNMDIDTGLKTPDLSLNAPHLKGGIDVPVLGLPNIDVEASQLDLNSPNVEIGSPQTKFRIPKLKMPTFRMSGLKGPNVDIHGDVKAPDFHSPDLHISDPNLKGKINTPDLKLPTANLKGPKLDVNAPNMNLKMPSGKLSVPNLKKPKAELDALDFDVDPPSGKLKMPSFGFSGKQPKRPNMDIDTGLKKPDLSLNAPHLKGGIDVPGLDLPNIDVKVPQLDLNSPNVDIGSPQTKFKLPKLKMPTFGMSGLKGPNVDIHGDVKAPDFHSPDLHISDPNLKGKINTPDLKLPTANLKGPKLDVNAPNMNLKMPSGKLSVPNLKKPKAELDALDFDVDPPSGKLKMPSFGFSGKQPKRPNMDIDTGLKTPDLSLNAPHLKGGIDVPVLDLPNIDVEAPQLDLNSPNVDIGSPQTKFKLPKLKMPTFGMSGLKGPNVDIHGDVKAPDFHSPEVHISDPNLKVKINTPDLKLPTANLKDPKLDVNAPNMNLKMPSGKLSVPNLKKPKAELDALDFDVDPPSGKLKMPSFGFSAKQTKIPNMDIDTGLKTPDLSLNAPHLKGGIDVPVLGLPNIDVEASQLDLNSPNVEIGSPQTKFRIPKLKMPTFRMSGLKGPNVDIHGDVKAPDFHSPDLHISDPNLKGKINTPDLKLPTANLKGPKLDVNAPNMNLKMPSGKLSVPNLKKPKAELDALDFDVDPPSGKLKMPSFGFSGKQPKRPNMDIDTGLKTPDLSLNAPHLKGGIDVPVLALPNIDVEAPQLDLNSPNVDIGSPQTKFRIPKLKMPTFGMSGIKGPNVDIHGDVNAPDFHSPDLHISDPKIKGKINAPDLKLPTAYLKGPKLDVNAPNMNLKMPSGKLSVPNLKKPKAELDALDFDVDPPSGKLKMPSFGFSGKQPKRPNMDIDTGLKTPDLSLNAPHLTGGIDFSGLGLPNIDVEAPQLDLNSPNVDIGSPQTKFKIPKPKMPRFGMSGLKGPNVDIHGDVKAPDFHSPDLQISDPMIKGNVNAPDLKLPTANLKDPKLDVNVPNMNFRGLNLTRASSDTDFGTIMTSRLPDMNISSPKAKLDIRDIKYDCSRTKHCPPTTTTSFVHNGVNQSLANVNSDLKLKMSAPELPFPKTYQQLNMNLGKNLDYHDHESHKKVPIHKIDHTKMTSKSLKKLEHKNAMLHSNEDKSPEDLDGYYVTVFPKQLSANARQQTGIAGTKESNHRGLDLSMSSLDLEVPEQNDLKGSTFWFSKLI